MANGDDHGPENLVLRILQDLSRKMDRLLDDMRDLKTRVTALEANQAIVSGRLDRIETRLDRIERRLELSEHA
jgi:predicted nuclease with TOPRIM domain